VEGKDVIIVDDMISSGESMFDVAKELKNRKARKVFICSTFGLFTNGLQKFDEYYGNGLIDRILTTNLIYQTPELLSRPYYIDVDMSKYIALIIDNLNHDASLSELLNPTGRINRLLEKYRAGIRE
ncbi:MAG: phosphoribosyltransferase family protein, partial [Eisenbergiella sp.]